MWAWPQQLEVYKAEAGVLRLLNRSNSITQHHDLLQNNCLRWCCQGGEGGRGDGDGSRGDDLESGLAPTGSHPVLRLQRPHQVLAHLAMVFIFLTASPPPPCWSAAADGCPGSEPAGGPGSSAEPGPPAGETWRLIPRVAL